MNGLRFTKRLALATLVYEKELFHKVKSRAKNAPARIIVAICLRIKVCNSDFLRKGVYMGMENKTQ